MKGTDLSPRLQKMLVPVQGHSGAHAIVPPSMPSMVPLTGIENDVYVAHEALAELKAITAALLNPHLITRTLDRREAVRSSQIEGSKSGVNELLEYEATGSSEGLPRDVLTTLNYVKALHYGLGEVQRLGYKALTVDLLRNIHRQLMDGDTDYRDTPGSLRSKQNWIAGLSIYQAKIVPPPPQHVEKLLDDMMSALQHGSSEEDQYSVSPVVRTAIAHAQFELIHPFLDGNGRVGRILLPLMLAADGYPPVYLAGYMKGHQAEYYKALGDAQLREQWPQWVRFIAVSVRESCRDAISMTHDLLAIKEGWHQRLSGLRSDASALGALDFVLSNPVITVNNLKEHLGVSFPAANSAIEVLCEKGILTISPKEGRSRVFIAKEVIARLENANTQPDIETESSERDRSSPSFRM